MKALIQDDTERRIVLRAVDLWKSYDDGAITVVVTPTYSGCPATEVIAQSIVDALLAGREIFGL